MKKYFIVAVMLLSSLMMASCKPSRDEADKKLALACINSIKALSDTTDFIEIQKTEFKSEKGNNDVSLRTVLLNAHFVHDGGVIVEKNYTCSYREQWNMISYMPEFYSLEKDGLQYGNFDGRLLGEMNDLIKINQETERVLY